MTANRERVTGVLYRLGMRHEDGNTSVASYAAGPARIVAGELAASVADLLVRHNQADTDRNSVPRAPLGPSTA